jgi:hypothetical protein
MPLLGVEPLAHRVLDEAPHLIVVLGAVEPEASLQRPRDTRPERRESS